MDSRSVTKLWSEQRDPVTVCARAFEPAMCRFGSNTRSSVGILRFRASQGTRMKTMGCYQCEMTWNLVLSLTLIARVDPSFVIVDVPKLLNELLPKIAIYSGIFAMLASIFMSSVEVCSNAASQATMLQVLLLALLRVSEVDDSVLIIQVSRGIFAGVDVCLSGC